MILIDSGAWFALFEQNDPHHAAAIKWYSANRVPVVITDYVLDETLTLLRSRGAPKQDLAIGKQFFAGNLAKIVHVTEEDVRDAWYVFRTFHDKKWSFTDCTSKIVMERLKIATAVSFDHHFRQFGNVTVVP